MIPVSTSGRSVRATLGGLLATLAIVLVPAAALAAADSTAAKPAPAPAPATLTIPAPKLGGYIQMREISADRTGLTAYLGRARFSVDGSLPSGFGYKLLTELEASAGAKSPATVSLREATIRWTHAPFVLSAGEFKTPFTREYMIPVTQLELLDLPTVIDSLAPKYDMGVMGQVALGATATLTLAVCNGEGANATSNRDSLVMFVGRADVRVLPQLSLGASGTRDGRDSLRWGLDAQVQQSGAFVRAEYATRHVSKRARGKDDFGWTVMEGYRVVRSVQLVARQEDFQRPRGGAAKRVRGLAWGSNIDLVPTRVKLLLELSRRVTGLKQLHTDTYIGQLQVTF